MASLTPPNYEKSKTALIIIDPINDFLAEDGKMYSFLQESLEKQDLVRKLVKLKTAALAASILVLYAPHRNFRDGDYDDWKHLTPTQSSAKASRFSELGSNGAQFHKDLLARSGDIVVSNHWSTSGFANTDLDHQLKRHGIEYIVICGLEALTCVENSGRNAVELGYNVTMTTDGTAGFTEERLSAAITVNAPAFAHAVCSVDQVVQAFKKAG
ncbi:hypothetical protein CBS101457_006953 [Exobasidium rhododendri]|nr:hypothetical protein CBS101457_006953 [Exobasidium rhododendri]